MAQSTGGVRGAELSAVAGGASVSFATFNAVFAPTFLATVLEFEKSHDKLKLRLRRMFC